MKIVTLTLNPSIDGAAQAEKVRPIHKIRTRGEHYDPGGGGINVAKVIHELGGDATAIYLAGGATGSVLDELVDKAGIKRQSLAIADHTRISQTVFESASGLEYRFVPEGPVVSEAEWRRVLTAMEDLECDYLVASGSLPRGVPLDFYGQVADIIERKGAKVVLDTSGVALNATLCRGVFLAKPSLGELESLTGRQLRQAQAQDDAAIALARSGAAEIMAVTLGRDGAIVATKDGVRRLAAPDVPVRNTVGAGDSFVAGMTFALARGRGLDEAFAYGVAAGAATVMSPGTGRCRREDVEALLPDLLEHLSRPHSKH